MACGRVIVGTSRVVTLPADRLHSVGGHRGWSRSSTLAVVCYLAVEWERAPDCSSAALSLRIPLVTANFLLGLVVQQFAEGVNISVVLRLRGGM